LMNNPGLVSLTVSLNFDDTVMKLTQISRGDALSEMTFTPPKGEAIKKGCTLAWDAEEVLPEAATNGVIIKFTFAVEDSATNGEYDVSLLNPDIMDNDLNPVEMQIVKGKVTIQ